MYRKRLVLGFSLISVSVVIPIAFLLAVHYFGAGAWSSFPGVTLLVLSCAFCGSFLVGKSLAEKGKRREWLAGLGVFISLISLIIGGFSHLIYFITLPSVLIGAFLVGFGLAPPKQERRDAGVRVSPRTRKLILAFSLVMLAGGCAGAIYGAIYRFAEMDRLLSAASGAIATAGGLSLWALLLLGRRGWLRRNIFAFGAFLMLLGVPLFIYFYLKAAVGIQEFAIVFGVMSLIAAGAAVLGALVCAACVLVSGPRK
jgi:MFS family permease